MLRVNEIFHSIQGESTHAGVPCVFVRLTGCNLRCVWCDTAYAFHEGRSMELEEVLAEVRSFGCSVVEVTGGEPLLQPEAIPLLRRLVEEGYEVLLETGGSLPIDDVPPGVRRIVDVKCPGSGESASNRWENLEVLREGDELKFVIADRDDYVWAVEQIRERRLDRRTTVLLSAVHDGVAPGDLARWVLDDRLPVRVQLQLHKIFWPGVERGNLMTVAPRAVVLLSGGLDSATTLALALREGFECHALTVRYGQRHGIEVERAARLARSLGAACHRVVDLDLGFVEGSALTDRSIAVPRPGSVAEVGSRIPVTYVPARNTVFLALALAWAETLGAERICIGANALDYSGYPDCRPEFLECFERLAAVGTRRGVEGRGPRIAAPLLRLTKAEIVRRALELGVDLAQTVSCYDPRADGQGCGACESCLLRAKGFAEAGVPDPAGPAPDDP